MTDSKTAVSASNGKLALPSQSGDDCKASAAFVGAVCKSPSDSALEGATTRVEGPVKEAVVRRPTLVRRRTTVGASASFLQRKTGNALQRPTGAERQSVQPSTSNLSTSNLSTSKLSTSQPLTAQPLTTQRLTSQPLATHHLDPSGEAKGRTPDSAIAREIYFPGSKVAITADAALYLEGVVEALGTLLLQRAISTGPAREGKAEGLENIAASSGTPGLPSEGTERERIEEEAGEAGEGSGRATVSEAPGRLSLESLRLAIESDPSLTNLFLT